MTMVRSGATTGVVTVVVAVLLFGLLSLPVAAVADKIGLVPVDAARGVMGTNTVIPAPFVMEVGLLQDTRVPEVAQLNPLLLNVADAVTLAGILSVKLTGPAVGAVPMLLRLTGTVLT